uniref:Uncharacterized protein n=1 Tax=Zea mays TaxID=4577 RepID=A0A804NFN1_MAIZE
MAGTAVGRGKRVRRRTEAGAGCCYGDVEDEEEEEPWAGAAVAERSRAGFAIVVVGSADIYVEVHRSPLIGETAARAARAPTWPPAVRPTYLVARVGDDANGRLLEDALADAGGVAPTASRARPMRHRDTP